MKRSGAVDHPRPARAVAGVLDRRLDPFGAAVGEEDHLEVARRNLEELARQQPRKRRDAHGDEVGQIEIHRLLNGVPNHRMIPPAGERAKAGKTIEIAVPRLVEKIRPFAARVTLIETEQAQHAAERRIDMLLGKAHQVVGLAGEERFEVER